MKISSYCLSNLYKNKIYDDDAFSLNKTVQEIISKACKIKENIEEGKKIQEENIQQTNNSKPEIAYKLEI